LDFEGADGASGVVGVEALGGGWIDGRKAGVELGWGEGGEGGAEVGVGWGALKEAFEKRHEVEGSSADGDEGDVAGAAGGDDAVC